MTSMCKLELSIAIIVSAGIALYELLFLNTGTELIIGVLALISAYYGFVLLKCCTGKPAKRKR